MKKFNNILIATDKFKFTLSAKDAVNAIYKGLKDYNNIKIHKLPIADGGEGTSEILSVFFNAKKVNITVNNPIFNKIKTHYYFSDKNKTAIIDLASASGLQLLKKIEQKPMQTSSFGTGEIILDALNKGAKKIIIGLGGSATNDCGIGAANALGYKFLNSKGVELKAIGKNLINISKIDNSNVTPLLKEVEIIALYDVKNKLYGKNGAAYVFAKQKGANNTEINILDKGLKNITQIIKYQYSKNISNIKGGGAAGGFGAGAFAFFNTKLIQGSNFIFDTINIDNYINNSDLIITGEGKFDKQSLDGKIVGELIKKADYFKKPTIVICGVSELKKEDVKSKYLQSIIPLFSYDVDIEIAKNKSRTLISERIRLLFKDYLYF
ncbi:MAG: glycerate kinase [Chlorobi bacterium]|nr:glycerate kinase [Chlorobiota bacterium]